MIATTGIPCAWMGKIGETEAADRQDLTGNRKVELMVLSASVDTMGPSIVASLATPLP